MRLAASFSMAIVLSWRALAAAPASHSHVNHGMILMGNEEIFASHIVAPEPHNWELLLQLRLPPDVKKVYLENRAAHPAEQLVLVLQHLDIGEVRSAASLEAALLRVDDQDHRTTLLPAVHFDKGDFTVLYLKELPLSLAGDRKERTVHGSAETGAYDGKYDRAALERDCDTDARRRCEGEAKRVSEWRLGGQSLPLEPGWSIVRLSADYVCR